MKWRKCLFVVSMFASTQVVFGATVVDTLDLMGGTASEWWIGWFGEAWKGVDWCGDTLVRDMTVDTVRTSDTLKDYVVSTPISDTVITTAEKSVMDSLTINTTTVDSLFVIKDSLNDPIVDIIQNYTKIIDSTFMRNCFEQTDFITDTGGFYPGALYFDFYYKFRKSWAQLPIVWANWAGIDSLIASPYKLLMIVYKGLLPNHRANMEFFYGTWGPIADTMRNVLKLGDGVGILQASPSEWKTEIIPIPDSVTLAGITGMVLGIGNVSSLDSATSEVGNLKVARVSLLSYPHPPAVRHGLTRRDALNNRYVFTPASGIVSLTIFSLKGEALASKNVAVQPGRRYSVRQFVCDQKSLASSQVRIATIKGEGVDITARVW